MSEQNRILLGVNIDHIATLREARGTRYPDPVQAAIEAEAAGADGITLHLRKDRRHIQDRDVLMIKDVLQTRMNLEMEATEEMIDFAVKVQPEHCCLVPENRQELTTEGGLDVISQEQKITAATAQLSAHGIEVSLFIDPEFSQIDAAKRSGAPVIELHTGRYADATDAQARKIELERIVTSVAYARQSGLIVNAGHGLFYHNVEAVAAIPGINELNIGHGIIARSVFTGLKQAIIDMKALIIQASKGN